MKGIRMTENPLVKTISEALPARSLMVNAYLPGARELSPQEQELIGRREKVLGSPYRLFYRDPVHVVRAKDAHLFDADGNDFLDAYNNVPSVGHSNPRVQAAVNEQMGKLNTHTRYLTDAVVAYAERLTALFPPPLSQVIFACTGSEAVDLALRIARHATQAKGIIITRNAYHGTTTAAAEISPSLGKGNQLPPYVAVIDPPDPVRGPGGEMAVEAFLAQIAAAVSHFTAQGIGFAGMIVDSVLSSDGLLLVPNGFLARAADLVRASGGVYIADEVQPGFGRTGNWWGFQSHRIGTNSLVPDLVVLGKPMGNGVPISAVVGAPDLFDSFGSEVRYFNTFGGNPVSIAAANAVLDEISERSLLGHAVATGARLLSGLCGITSGSDRVAEVRGAGLFLSVEYVKNELYAPDPATALSVVNALRDRRILVSASGMHENVLKIRPPLVFNDGDSTRFLEAFDEVMQDI